MAEPLIPGGYILLSRKLIESEIWRKPPIYLKVWIYLLSSAQHKQYKSLSRGQLFTSIPEIQEACSWYVGFRKHKPSKDQIFNVLEWFRNQNGNYYRNSCESNDESNDASNGNTTMIATTRATQGMLVSIVNYNVYQDSKNYESNDESNDVTDTKATTGALREQRQADNINKNDKNDKNVNNEQEDISICETEEEPPKKEPKKPKPKKDKYGEFEKVSLTLDEFNKLIDRLGQPRTKEMIARLDTYKASTGKRYSSDYATILNWHRNDIAEGKYDEKKQQSKSKPQPQPKQSNLTDLLNMIEEGVFDE